jgi:hypothetical protein
MNELALIFSGVALTGSSLTQGTNNVGTVRLNNWTVITN